MAVYIPIRPKWNPRGVVVNYVSWGQLCVRSWPRGYRDANTATQRRQRGKMAQVCCVLPHVKNLLAEGFSPLAKRNGRKIGSYHMAVSTALREWFIATPHGDELDCARLQLTDGVRPLPDGLLAARRSGTLRIAWNAPLRWSAPKLLLAIREPRTNQWVSTPIALDRNETNITAHLPKAWKGKETEIWIAFVGRGQGVKTKTLHLKISAPATVSTTPSPKHPCSPTPSHGNATATMVPQPNRRQNQRRFDSS